MRLPVTPLKYTRSCSPAAKAAPLQGDDRRFESVQDYSRPGYAKGKAARLKPKCLWVRIPLRALWLGRQLADHLGLEPEMSTNLRSVPGFDAHLSH